MFNLVICLVLLILKAEADLGRENPAIYLDYNYDSQDIYKVWIKKPLQIFIRNSYARFVWCSNAYTKSGEFRTEYEQFVPETKYKTENVSILNITEVTAEMSTRWSCVILQEYHGPKSLKHKNKYYTAKNIYFNLHVKGIRAVKLTANGRHLTYVTTNLSVSYDGAASYTYEDGEYVDFSCLNARDRFSTSETRLEYYNAEGILLFQTESRVNQEQIFRSVLKSESDKNYLNCILTTVSPAREYMYRTTFYMKKQEGVMEPTIILSVNEQDVPKFPSKDQTSDGYIFKYIEGEVLNVTCRKIDDKKQGPLIFYFDKAIDLGPALGNPEREIILLNVSTSKINNKTLSCGINNTNVQKPNAMLLFSSDVPDYDVRIRGLLRDNVMYQYFNGLGQWTIVYQYSVNDTLSLTCVSKYGFHASNERRRSFQQLEEQQFQWKFEGQTIESPAISMSLESKVIFSNKTFTKTLDATHNGTKIQCVYNNPNIFSKKSVEIILRLKPEIVFEGDSDGLARDVGSKVRLIVPVGSVGVAAAIVTMICLAYWRKRTKRSNLIQNAYDNFSNRNDSPIPAFPKQWENDNDDSHYSKIDEGIMQENYSYATTGNEKLYRIPHKRLSNISENHYSEIDEYFKPKTDGLATNWNNTLESQATESHHSKSNLSYNTKADSKYGAYDKLRHSNLPFNKDLNLSEKTSKKNKNVTFGPNLNSKQDGMNDDRRFKQIIDSSYANIDQGIYMQPGDMQKKPKFENHFVQNEKTEDPIDLDYAEPYSDIEIICKNEFYG